MSALTVGKRFVRRPSCCLFVFLNFLNYRRIKSFQEPVLGRVQPNHYKVKVIRIVKMGYTLFRGKI